MKSRDFDVIIVGAGLSGIGAAHHLQARCPGKSYAILEGRETLGGTWDLFRYPGIRSDSDMHTLGYSFRPWTNPKAIADGPAILDYVRQTAKDGGIDQKIRYGHRVVRASYSTRTATWTVEAHDVRDGSPKQVTLTCQFLFVCAGYYDYDEGYTPEYPGRERFLGKMVHPQKWTSDIVYEGKRVVVIGSGATAVTLVPELAKRAAHVTMLQRSPTYIVTIPERDKIANWMRERLPEQSAYAATRWKNILLTMAFYKFCRSFPEQAKKLLLGRVARSLRGSARVDPHFTPSYKPWDQRLCVVPNGDLFKAIRNGRASVATGTIETFTETGIRLHSGEELAADLIVSATGLKLKFLGGMQVEVDGARIETSKTMAYKGLMFSDIPNLAVAIGYTNASWTLKCDLTSEYVCRLLNYMDEKGYVQCCPRRSDPSLREEPIIDLTSSYVKRSVGEFPKQGSFTPWKLHQNYALDRLIFRGRLDDGAMEFTGERRADAPLDGPAPAPATVAERAAAE